MKTKNFMGVIATFAVMVPAVMFTSCSSDDEPVLDVIESEVTESGLDNQVALSGSSNSGVSLSYQSWILVKGQTRADFESKVVVNLKDCFDNDSNSKEQEVKDFTFGEPEIAVSYYRKSQRKESSFVTVSDSVLVYSLEYSNGFKLDYELEYEVAEYNDGVTVTTMPYHQIENIRDNGVTISDMDDVTVKGTSYLRKKCNHSLTVYLNGESYDVSSEVIVRSPKDVLSSSKVVKQGIDEISFSADSLTATYQSWLEIEQEWSVSGKKSFRVTAELYASIVHSVQRYTMDIPEKWDWMNPIYIDMEAENPAFSVGERQNEAVKIVTYQLSRDMGIQVNETKEKLVYMNTDFFYEQATYSDDKLEVVMPYYEFERTYYEFAFSGTDWQEKDDGVWYHPIALRVGGWLNNHLLVCEYTDEFRYK